MRQIVDYFGKYPFFLRKMFAVEYENNYFCTASYFEKMANEKVLISGIEYKVRKLIENYRLVSAENKELKEEVNAIQEQLAALQELLNKKNNELLKLTLANALENKFGVEKGIQIIDELLEEIDRSVDVISN